MNSDLISIFHKGMPIASQGKSIKEFLATDKHLFTAGARQNVFHLKIADSYAPDLKRI
jgi:hypothetical protein